MIHGHGGLRVVMRVKAVALNISTFGLATAGGAIVRGPAAQAGSRTPGPGDRHGITRIPGWNETRKMPCIALADLAAPTPARGQAILIVDLLNALS